ncbi:DNA primase [Roseateles sp. SL47]|uniref:DNA primase n=1 Tax=Roseateles sp. SL47 TaxID=2995138 RepID=UPI00227111D0|nr:DNA primase [Roseateles sp. SL47]WAC72689.1 DNA primase [Roseateles sp. SL47]
MIPPGFIQDLLSRVDIVDVVSRHVDLKKAGINHKGLCPFHGEKSPSFIVSPSRQTYHCFGCGVHGNAVGFLMEHLGIGFVDAVRDLAQQAGMQVPEDDRSPAEREREKQVKQRQATLTEVLAKASQHYRQQLKTSPRAIDYLKGRGLTGQIAAQFGLGYSPEGWRTLASAFPAYDDPLLVETGLVILQDDPGKSEAEQRRYDRFRDRIMFPIRNVQGDVIGFGGRVLDKGEPKYLNSPETPVFSKGKELYGLYEARPDMRRRGYALVVEGYMDVVALAQSGFGNAVATLGTACTQDHVQKLFRFTESVVFSFDGDAAGRRAAGRAMEAALPHATETRSIKFLFLPAEHDPDSYVRELGPEAFERCVEQAIPLSRQLMDSAAEGCDLGSPEGRARMLTHARPLWSALPDGLLKRQLLGELARRAQLPDQELLALWQASAGAPRLRGERSDRPQERQDRPQRATAHPGGDDHAPHFPDIPASAYADEEFHGDPHDIAPPPDAYGAGSGAGLGSGGTSAPAWAQGQGQGSYGGAGPHGGGFKGKGEFKGKGDFKGKGGKWGDWKRREQDPTIGMPRKAPPAPMDHAVRMLLLHGELWNVLSEQDLQLLHELPGEHGQLIAWLERFMMDHGPSPWAVLQIALVEADQLELAQRVCGGPLSAPPADESAQDEFRHVMRKLWIVRLEQEASSIATSPTPDISKLKLIRTQIEELKAV